MVHEKGLPLLVSSLVWIASAVFIGWRRLSFSDGCWNFATMKTKTSPVTIHRFVVRIVRKRIVYLKQFNIVTLRWNSCTAWPSAFIMQVRKLNTTRNSGRGQKWIMSENVLHECYFCLIQPKSGRFYLWFSMKCSRPARKLKDIGDKLFMAHVSNGLPVIIFFLYYCASKLRLNFRHTLLTYNTNNSDRLSNNCYNESLP